MPRDFSHDFLADRAKVFVTQHEMSRHIPGHISSYDVSGYYGSGELNPIGDAREFFQVVEVAYGSSYSADFQSIKDSGKLGPSDLEKADGPWRISRKAAFKTFKGASGGCPVRSGGGTCATR